VDSAKAPIPEPSTLTMRRLKMEEASESEVDTVPPPATLPNRIGQTREAPPEAKQETPEVPSTCPRCQGKLTDPNGLGWCQACGYCRSLEEDREKVPLSKPALAAPRVSLFGLVECCQMLTMLPRWAWVLGGGTVAVVLVAAAAGQLLPRLGLERSLWGTVAMGVGGVIMVGAQIAALVAIAPHDERLSGKDLLFPARLWALTLKRLPATRWQVWFWVWGLTLIIGARHFLDGFRWVRFPVPRKVSLVHPHPPQHFAKVG
jgi:hypothetical protein